MGSEDSGSDNTGMVNIASNFNRNNNIFCSIVLICTQILYLMRHFYLRVGGEVEPFLPYAHIPIGLLFGTYLPCKMHAFLL